MRIVPREAAAVQKIFEDFFMGKSRTKTAEELNEQGIYTVLGNPMSSSAVSFILRNITYTGSMLLQKTYIQDPIMKKKRINRGELQQYFVENTHPAIIDMDTFQQVQRKLNENKQQNKFPYNRTNIKYPFTGKIICDSCGRHYTRQLWKNMKKERPTWVCTGKKSYGTRECKSQNILEKRLYEISCQVLKCREFDPVFVRKKF